MMALHPPSQLVFLGSRHAGNLAFVETREKSTRHQQFCRHILAHLRSLVASAALVLAAASPAISQESRLDEVLKRGKVIVGVTSEAPPFGFVDEHGELTGFDVELAKLVAKAIFNDASASRIEFVKQSFASRWPNVNNGVVDFGIQVTTILPDRVTRVGFTRAYIDSGVVMVVKKDSPIKKLADLDKENISVSILTTPLQAENAKRYFPKAKTVVLDSIAAQFTSVKTNRADAAQLDKPVALWYAKSNPDVRILDEELGVPTNNAIFLKLGDFKWWQVLDTIVGELVGGSMRPEYVALYEKYFGMKPPHAKHYIKAN